MGDTDGWYRFGAWCAHYYADGKKLCNVAHQHRDGGLARGLPLRDPLLVEVGPHGIPHGRVCQRCQKLLKIKVR